MKQFIFELLVYKNTIDFCALIWDLTQSVIFVLKVLWITLKYHVIYKVLILSNLDVFSPLIALPKPSLNADEK